jgi:hypothetical protein
MKFEIEKFYKCTLTPPEMLLKFILFVSFYFSVSCCRAQDVLPADSLSDYSGVDQKLSPLSRFFFKDVKCKLSIAEKNKLTGLLNFVITKDSTQPYAMDKESLEFPFNAIVKVTDMNKDGMEEVFVQFGNAYTSGDAGSSVVLFIKNKKGDYQLNLGFPGMMPEFQKTINLGYPDLLIGGPGFEQAVWRWNGKEYQFYKKVKM